MIRERIRDVITVAVAFCAGFVGTELRLSTIPVGATSGEIVRASRIELIDGSGTRRAYLSLDGPGETPSLQFITKQGVTRLAIGLNHDAPFVNLMSRNSTTLASLTLVGINQKPLLAMSDEHWEGRVLLGFLEPDTADPSSDDWALLFRGPQRSSDSASIGIFRDPITGRVGGRVLIQRPDGTIWPPVRKK